nr:CNT_HP1_G0046510.mRNA.1.CDS.1 [Saccharomyces cerevisiae]
MDRKSLLKIVVPYGREKCKSFLTILFPRNQLDGLYVFSQLHTLKFMNGFTIPFLFYLNRGYYELRSRVLERCCYGNSRVPGRTTASTMRTVFH